ncbi:MULTISPECIES: hypothetical protein [unclassified Pseudoxanthomonas]|uniref:hypothetical protein n=1 Tax=unclassified Pseudoxanthomonas TaxID=2645906 RepID=UPI0008EB5565|nr:MULTISPECIES: hypothetical protein [unclassified Pseudoxanthomonas]PPJ41810.1 hypothetical protein C0063_00395 [Pseudoxanthomonas sp. KAs_5_3]SFV29584.1 hypothetical protein SAMN05428990_1359 [Pseudoxanthomonas sp. YR558]
MPRLIARSLTLALATALSGGMTLPAHAAPQSDGASRMSQASLEASIEVPVAVIHALGHGASAVVTGVAVVAGSVAVTVSVAAAGVVAGASFVVYLSVEAIRRLGIAVGTAISVAVVATGWILSAAGEALCFIANDAARPHIHSHRYGG